MKMLSEGPIKTRVDGMILEVTLDRPKANAIDLATSRIMGDVFKAFRDDDGLRVAILRAELRPWGWAAPSRQSSTSPPSRTTRRRPCAAKAASTSSVFMRPNRSRCSTTTTVTFGSASRRRTLDREPFIPEPTSASTRTT